MFYCICCWVSEIRWQGDRLCIHTIFFSLLPDLMNSLTEHLSVSLRLLMFVGR